jgi:hypothetical protein
MHCCRNALMGRRDGLLLLAAAAFAAGAGLMLVFRWQQWYPMCVHSITASGRPYVSC